MARIEPRAIVVRMPNWVGDVVMATPALRALDRLYPEARITVALSPHLAPLLAGLPGIDAILEIPKAKGIGGVFAAARLLRAGGFDLAVLLTNSFRSAAESFLARIPARAGYRADGRGLLLTHGPERRLGTDRAPLPMPMVDYYLELVAMLGGSTTDRGYALAVTPAEEAAALVWFAQQGIGLGERLLGLNPGASFGASKLWQPDRFARVGDLLREELGLRPVLLGGPGEKDLLRDIAGRMARPPAGGADAIVPLGLLKAIVRRLALLVTTDTGPRAIAQAMGIPSVVLMGPTHPAWTAANNEAAIVLRHDVPCGPCHLKICPLDHACMEQITVAEVLAAAGRLLSRSPSPGT